MADDLVNALQTANRSSTVLQGIANPPQVNPLAAITAGNQAAQAEFTTRGMQAQQALGNILQQSTDPNGNVDYQKAHTMAAQAGPIVQMGMAKFAGEASQLRGSQIVQTGAMQRLVGMHNLDLLRDSSDENVNRTADDMLRNGMPAEQAEKYRSTVLGMNDAQRKAFAYRANLNSLDSLHQIIGQTTGVNTGGQIQGVTVTQPGPGTAGGVSSGSGGVTTTADPATVLGMPDVVYPATIEDVRAGRARAVGEPQHVSGADRATRFGLGGLLPPGAREVPAPGGGGGARGPARGPAVVRDSTGKPVSPANPPRLLNVPGAAPAVPAATIPPAPGSVAPPIVGPRTSLEGGVPVASTDASMTPETGAPGAPSPMVGANVADIQAGMAQARANPRPAGTQTAYNTLTFGPGAEEVEHVKTSAAKLAADDAAATTFQANQIPYLQALRNYGEGTKTGPGTDFWHQVAGSIRTPLAKLGMNIGALDDNTKRVDELKKMLATISASNPISAKSDAMLAQVLQGSASTHINETAGEDMVKSGHMLLFMNQAANREWHRMGPDAQRQHGTYLRFLGDYNDKVDPRAFGMDMYNDAQKARLRDQLRSGSEEDAVKFKNTLDLARRNGYVTGTGTTSRALPF